MEGKRELTLSIHLKILFFLYWYIMYLSSRCVTANLMVSMAYNISIYFIVQEPPYLLMLCWLKAARWVRICSTYLFFPLRSAATWHMFSSGQVAKCERPSQAHGSFQASAHVKFPNSPLKQVRWPRLISMGNILYLLYGGDVRSTASFNYLPKVTRFTSHSMLVFSISLKGISIRKIMIHSCACSSVTIK